MKKLLTGDELISRCNELGIDIFGETIVPNAPSAFRKHASEFELQHRVLEAERSRRESKLWIIALISALASLISALAAWFAVMIKR